MKSDPVSFAVENDSPKAVGTDLMSCLKDLATLSCNRKNCLRKASLSVEIDEGANLRRRVVVVWRIQAASDVASGMGQQSEDKTWAALFRDGTSEYRRIEGDGSVEVEDGNIDPDDAVAHGDAPFRGREWMRGVIRLAGARPLD